MIQHEVTIHLNKPVEQVFAFLADTSKLTTWQSNLIKSEQITAGPLRTGSRFREIRRMGKRESEIEGEITAFEPNKQLETRTVTKPQAMVSYSLDPENEWDPVEIQVRSHHKWSDAAIRTDDCQFH